jgi:hypothetical protein
VPTRAAAQTTGIDPPVATPNLQVYFPAAVGTPHCVIFNNGASPAYLGGSGVTSATGLQFPPGAQLSLPNAGFGIWAVDGGLTLGTVSTTLTINAAAGGTVLAVAGTASLVAGVLLQIGNNNRPVSQETVIISTVPNAGSVTTTTPLQMDHVSGGTVWTISGQQATALSVNASTT